MKFMRFNSEAYTLNDLKKEIKQFAANNVFSEVRITISSNSRLSRNGKKGISARARKADKMLLMEGLLSVYRNTISVDYIDYAIV